MRVASDVKSSESPDSGSGATPNVFSKSAGSTKKNAVLRYSGNCSQKHCIGYCGSGAGLTGV
jgi:hypothetical protein